MNQKPVYEAPMTEFTVVRIERNILSVQAVRNGYRTATPGEDYDSEWN